MMGPTGSPIQKKKCLGLLLSFGQQFDKPKSQVIFFQKNAYEHYRLAMSRHEIVYKSTGSIAWTSYGKEKH